MYRVTVKTDGTEYLLHDPRFDDTQIYNDELSEEMGKTPTFTFDIPAGHPNADKLLPLSSEVFVYRDDEIIFYGREISPSTDLYNTRTVECIGALSYLADSMIAPFDHTGSLTEFLSTVIEKHNAMVEARKQFTLGRVMIEGETGYRKVTGYADALSLLSNLIVGAYGGYLRVRLENGVQYLDYAEDYGGTNSQQIRFGENVLDLTRQIDASDVVTCLIAQGAEDENGSRQTVTVIDDAAVSKWGKIWAQVAFDSITDAAVLQAAAEAYLLKLTALPERVEFNALDLHLADVDITALRLGYWTHFVSEPHGISGDYLLRKRTLHITAPQNDTVIFGAAEEQTLTGTSLADKKAAEDANIKVQNNFSSLKASTDTKVSSLEDNVQYVVSKVQDAEGNIAELQTSASAVQSKVQDMEGNVSTLEQTANSLKSQVSDLNGNYSSLEQTANKINWLVKSGTSSSNFTLTDRAIELVASNITLTGYVKFDDLSKSGSTTINGANITTGTIDLKRVGYNGYPVIDCTGSSTAPTITMGKTNSSGSLYATKINLYAADIQIGEKNDTGRTLDLLAGTINLIYNSQITFKTSTNSSYYVILDNNRIFRPNSTGSTYGIGSSSYRWTNGYFTNLDVLTSITLGNSSGKIGFFGKTPIARKTVSSSATVSTLITALKDYGLIA